jgi:hypothetical protein
MKIFSKTLFIFLIGLSLIQAQSNQKQFSFPAKNASPAVFNKDTLRILAVMVEFPADKYDATIGTGKFNSHFSSNYNDTIIDPLPHNAAYFGNHLEFAKNYFKKVSNGKLNVKYQTLPDVITVSKMMREYCPPYQSTDFTLLGDLSKEAWTLAYQKYPSFNFGDYDLFIVFHAGVSNSLNTGSYEINRNLPAIYLGESTFTKIFGTGFKGLVNAGSSNVITNSIIMPETESREQTSVDGSVSLLQISINGELVSNIASYLGLPDLYNTETGMSAIGRFGLMDGQAIVANLGIFPPEPSAWEKVYLGWETPVTASLKSVKASIAARKSASASDTTLFKIPINDYEYYLVENRQQDALNDGIKLTYKKGDQTFTQVLTKDSEGLFTFSDSNIKGGVVVDVDEFDAAVPGNGIVIWHIDEKVINEKLSTGGINNTKLRRGVAVVEADGVNDIGEIITTVFGDNIGEGTMYDFFYLGNAAQYYKNKFSDDTKPSARANNGSNSYIVMQNFTASASKMSFNLSFGGAVEQKYVSKLSFTSAPGSLISVKEGNSSYNYILTGTDLQKYDSTGTLLKTYTSFSSYTPLYFTNSDTNYVAGSIGKKINILNINSGSYRVINTNYSITASLVYYQNTANTPILLAGNDNGDVFGEAVTGTAVPIALKLSSKIIKINSTVNYFSAFSEYGFSDNSGTVVSIPYKIQSASLTKNNSGSYVNVVLTEGNRFYVVVNNVIIAEFKINETSSIQSFILADIENNGENDIVFTAGGNLYAVTQKGVIVDNYPLSLASGTTFQPDILSFNYDSDKSADFVTFTSEGDIYFINGKTAKKISGLTLSTGSKVILSDLSSIPNSTSDNLALTVLTENYSLYTWDLLLSSDKKIWGSKYSDNTNGSYLGPAVSTTVTDVLLPAAKTYNWPNPVYGTSTNIRFYVNEDSQVKIKIFDMGGQLVAEFQKDAQGNCDTEVVWNVNGIASNVYFARIEAVGKSGKTDYKIIKIAVIK